MKSKLFYLCLIFIFCACKKDNDKPQKRFIGCPNPLELGEFKMLESSKSVFPYSLSDSKAIFSDSLGNELMGLISNSISSNLYASRPSECINDLDSLIIIKAQLEAQISEIEFDSLNLSFRIEFSVSPNLQDYSSGEVADYAFVSVYGDSIFDIRPQTSILLDKRTSNASFTNSIDNFEIHSKSFGEIYTNTIKKEEIQFYFNIEQGLIGFHDKRSGFSYKLERIE